MLYLLYFKQQIKDGDVLWHSEYLYIVHSSLGYVLWFSRIAKCIRVNPFSLDSVSACMRQVRPGRGRGHTVVCCGVRCVGVLGDLTLATELTWSTVLIHSLTHSHIGNTRHASTHTHARMHTQVHIQTE